MKMQWETVLMCFSQVRQVQETEIPNPFNTAQTRSIEAWHIYQKKNFRIEFRVKILTSLVLGRVCVKRKILWYTQKRLNILLHQIFKLIINLNYRFGLTVIVNLRATLRKRKTKSYLSKVLVE
jgi:transposase